MKNSPWKKIILAAVCLALLGTSAVGIYHDNRNIGTTRYVVKNHRIPAEFDGFTIAQVSDLHNTKFGSGHCALIGALKKAAPDIIVITGDLIDSRRTDRETAMDFIRQAVEIAPVYYTPGNHEARDPAGFAVLEASLTEPGVQVLRENAVLLEQDSAQMQLMGLEDPGFWEKGTDITKSTAEKLDALADDGDLYTILLSHRPDLMESYAGRADLVFSGHAHGGQIRLPWIGGVFAPDQGLFPKYDCGRYTSGGTTMIVSRGLGNSLFPFRVNDPPELVVVILETDKPPFIRI